MSYFIHTYIIHSCINHQHPQELLFDTAVYKPTELCHRTDDEISDIEVLVGSLFL